MNMERIYFIMKNFIFISACTFSITVNAQANYLNVKRESKVQGISCFIGQLMRTIDY